MVTRRSGNTAPPPLRVFVGTSAGDDAEACIVLEATLRKHSTVPLQITWLNSATCPGWETQGWSTPWSAYRWAVPELCNWTGRAVYMDCPQVVIGDVAALASAPIPEGTSVLLRKSGGAVRTGVMVWDCTNTRKWVPSLRDLKGEIGVHQRLSALVAGGSSLSAELPAGWAVQDVEYSDNPARATGSVHYANAHIQPHQSRARRRLRAAGRTHWFVGTRLPHFSQGMIDMFEREYAAALAEGYVLDDYTGGIDHVGTKLSVG
jgi:hypothetical protein